jgi:hypothetical protein
VAHEIGNPLGSILGYTELLKRRVPQDETAKDYLSRIENEITRIHHIVLDLLDYSRPSGNELGPVDVNGVVEEAVSLFSRQKSAACLDLKTALAVDAGLVEANAARLKQVLINLLFNARDAVSDDGRVVVSTLRKHPSPLDRQSPSPTHDMVVISVSDTGTGIPPSDLEKIFDPFFTTKPPGKGTGLGLSVSLRIVQSLGGTLQVESEQGRGTVFTITLKGVG